VVSFCIITQVLQSSPKMLDINYAKMSKMTSQRIIMEIVEKHRNQGLRDDHLILFSSLHRYPSIYSTLIFFKIYILMSLDGTSGACSGRS